MVQRGDDQTRPLLLVTFRENTFTALLVRKPLSPSMILQALFFPFSSAINNDCAGKGENDKQIECGWN